MRESLLVIANVDVSSPLATWSLHAPDSLQAGTINFYRTGDRNKTVLYDTTSNNEEGNDNVFVVMDGASTMPGTGAGMKCNVSSSLYYELNQWLKCFYCNQETDLIDQ